MSGGARFVAFAFAVAAPVGAAESYRHQGSLGLYAAPGGGLAVLGGNGAVASDQGPRWVGQLGGTLAFDPSGNELAVWVRLSGASALRDAAAVVGYRGYFGYDQLKTFFDLGVAAFAYPALMAGPRVGIGVQYELSPIVGALCGAGLLLGLGAAVVGAADLYCGLQLRTYLFE